MITRTDLQYDVVIIACAISAGIHAALTPDHFSEGAGAGIGFLAATIVLAVLVVALARRPASRGVLLGAVVTLAGLIASYVLAVTTGFPVLHPEAEPVEGLALFTKAVEFVGLIAALSLPSPQPRGALA